MVIANRKSHSRSSTMSYLETWILIHHHVKKQGSATTTVRRCRSAHTEAPKAEIRILYLWNHHSLYRYCHPTLHLGWLANSHLSIRLKTMASWPPQCLASRR